MSKLFYIVVETINLYVTFACDMWKQVFQQSIEGKQWQIHDFSETELGANRKGALVEFSEFV